MEVTGVVTIGTKERSKRDMKKIVFAFGLIVAVAMTACTPETRNQMLGIPDDAILLSTENFASNDTKTSVRGTSVIWVAKDSIDFYVGTGAKQPRGVEVSGGNAYISRALDYTGVTEDINIRGYYPAGNSDGNETTDGPRLKLPAEYTCSVSGGRQVIALPMVGKADTNATSIKFKHITAAVNVKLKNSVGSDLYVDKVVVTSETYQVCTPTGYTHNLSRDDLGVSASTVTGNRSVTVNFSGDDFLVKAGSDSMCVQVPIRPIGSDHLTIEVYCHSATKSYHYSYRPDDAVAAVGRNEVLTAMVDLKLTAIGGHMEEVVSGNVVNLHDLGAVYTYNATDGVILTGTSQKNLTCNIPNGAKVTLMNVNNTSTGLLLKSAGNATIIISGKNTINASNGKPVIYVASGYGITIKGDDTDTLIATVTGETAAIGAYSKNACGNIIIEGGTIMATANGNSAAIGASVQSSPNATCGNITISGGRVRALNNSTDSKSGAGIGCGASGCGNIIISGGSVVATGYNYGAGIGSSGSSSACGTITITTGVDSVTVTKGSRATHSIGMGSSSSTCGIVTIGGTEGYIATSPYTYSPSK